MEAEGFKEKGKFDCLGDDDDNRFRYSYLRPCSGFLKATLQEFKALHSFKIIVD